MGANNRDEINGMLFEIGEVAVFRGTDGLDFNLLKITKNVKFCITPRTKIKGNFLLESNTLEDGSAIFAENPLWRGATMTFAHILRDKDESIVTVNLAELNRLGGTFYKMNKETFLELVCVSQDFENSLEKENIVVDELVEAWSIEVTEIRPSRFFDLLAQIKIMNEPGLIFVTPEPCFK